MNKAPNEPQSGDETVENLGAHWQKICAILMLRNNETHVAIGPEDVAKMLAFEGGHFCIVVQEGRNGDGLLHLDLMSLKDAIDLKAKDVLKRTSRGQRP